MNAVTDGPDRFVLDDSRVDDDTGELVDTWKNEQTGQTYEKRLGGQPDTDQDPSGPDDGGDVADE